MSRGVLFHPGKKSKFNFIPKKALSSAARWLHIRKKKGEHREFPVIVKSIKSR